jgi:hypothetical protein
MTKEAWIKHMEETTGLIRPSLGGYRMAWVEATTNHINNGCEACKERSKTKNKASRRKERDQMMKDCGLVKVRGALGGVYWE